MAGFNYKSVSYLEIERPERYVKQLNSHLSKKADFLEGFLLFQDLGAGEALALPTSVKLTAHADSQEHLDKVQNILAKHLYKFAKITDQTPVWHLEKKNDTN